MVIASKRFNDCVWLRRICAILVILLVGASNAVDMVKTHWNFLIIKFLSYQWTFLLLFFQFASSLTTSDELRSVYNMSIHNYTYNSTHSIQPIQIYVSRLNFSATPPSSTCVFPSYFNYFAILILIAIAIITQLSHLTRIILMLLFAGELIDFKINSIEEKRIGKIQEKFVIKLLI